VRLVEEVRSGLGLILVSSPAFDGAGTTCYSIMSFLAQGQRDVLSIESPIQWTIDGVRQVEAEASPTGPRMEETLRAMAAVRPDVLMLSAIPDYPTLLLSVQLASSRLVIVKATSPSAARALVGLREMGAPAQLLSGSLGLVLGQRLIRTLCRICRVEAEAPPLKTLEAHGIDRDEAEKLVFYKGKGCPTCNTIGYRGRRAIFEAIPAAPEVRAALEKGQPSEAVETAAVEAGMITIRERALGLVRSGVTSFDEFARLRL
jgi:type II secretory ATPase GspE/PulE/Tfp pilus assembly ATPase PilB-like protein